MVKLTITMEGERATAKEALILAVRLERMAKKYGLTCDTDVGGTRLPRQGELPAEVAP